MRVRALVALVVGAALTMAACGSSSKSSSPSTTAAGGATTTAAAGGKCKVGVSWNNYQEERWAKWDEPAIKKAVEAGGGTYISNDAKSSAETQATNVENLISQGAKVLIILAQDGTAIKPSVANALVERRARSSRTTASSRTRARSTSPSTTSWSASSRPRRSSAPCRRATTSSSRATRPTPTPTSCASGMDQVIKAAVDVRRHQDRRRDLHRQLGPVEGPDRDGAVPHRDQQQGRRGPVRERRHGRWRRGRADGPGPRGQGAGLRSGRRPGRPQPDRARHRRPSTSGRTPACSARPPATRPSQLCKNKDVDQGHRHHAVQEPGWQQPHVDPAQAGCRSPRPTSTSSSTRAGSTKANAVQGREGRARSRSADPTLHHEASYLGQTLEARGAGSATSPEPGPQLRSQTLQPPLAGVGDRRPSSTPVCSGMVVALAVIWISVQRPVERRLPHAAQPLQPLGPEHVDRDHGHGHGPDHRVAQHRPVGRVAARVPRLHDGHGADRRRHRLLRLPGADRRTRRQAVHVAGRAARGRRARRPGRRPARAHRRLRRGARRSSSRWAASWSGAARSSERRQAGPDARAPAEHLPAARWRSQGFARRVAELGFAAVGCAGVVLSI